jgi:hypothetical protein
LLVALDIFYTILHLALIGFNLFAWIWPKTRKAHLITAGLTLASWVGLGIWFGFGYCPITDWQWDVKQQLGERDLPNSFVKYFADRLTGRDLPVSLVDGVTLWSFVAAILCSVYVNFFHKTKRRRPSGS